MFIEKANILELKIQLGRHRLAQEELEQQIEVAENPVVKSRLEKKLKEEKYNYRLLQKYIENIENLYETAKNGEVLQEKVDVPDDKIEQMCAELEQECAGEIIEVSFFDEEGDQPNNN